MGEILLGYASQGNLTVDDINNNYQYDSGEKVYLQLGGAGGPISYEKEKVEAALKELGIDLSSAHLKLRPFSFSSIEYECVGPILECTSGYKFVAHPTGEYTREHPYAEYECAPDEIVKPKYRVESQGFQEEFE